MHKNFKSFLASLFITSLPLLHINCPLKASQAYLVAKEDDSSPAVPPLSLPRVSEEETVNYLAKRSLFILPQASEVKFEAGIPDSAKIKADEFPIHLGLSIDGGGIRGVMPAVWLSYLEGQLRNKYGQRTKLYEVFDCIGGTSIGGILALGLSQGMPASSLVELFDMHGGDIFSSDARSFIQLLDFWGIISHRYQSDALDKILDEKFGIQTLAEAKTDVLVTACTTDGRPKVFRNTSKNSDEILMRHVARASSAAPTYFKSFTVRSKAYIDGGIWCNNPSILVAARLVNTHPEDDWRESVHMLSLGTGESKRSPIPQSSGKAAARKIIDALMTSHGQGNHSAMKQMFGDHYQRIDAYLEDEINLDEFQKTGLLKDEAAKYLHKVDYFLEKYEAVISSKIADKRANQ